MTIFTADKRKHHVQKHLGFALQLLVLYNMSRDLPLQDETEPLQVPLS